MGVMMMPKGIPGNKACVGCGHYKHCTARRIARGGAICSMLRAQLKEEK